jgi:Asp-tRNA(Asn)/Glu-tRNA(Gln) amidotransferase A subunit family amidase
LDLKVFVCRPTGGNAVTWKGISARRFAMPYDLTPMRAPRAAGSLLKWLTAAVEAPLFGPLLARKLIQDAGIGKLQATACLEPLPERHAVLSFPKPPEGGALPDLAALTGPTGGRWDGETVETIGDFAAAYRAGLTNPEAVAERVLAATAAADRQSPALRAFIAQDREDILRQARESAERHRQGCSLGPLDGVPVAIKDELHQAGYCTTVGTRFLGKDQAKADATVVARLRAAGALLIGKANMHELGLGVTGINPHHGAARNPYDRQRAAGGSSGGSAAAVAAGFCPVAIGADGGGSIRIPAAFCGVVGLKATFGRISEHGAAPVCWSVGHVGPIGATVRDVMAAYAVIAGPDPADPATRHQPLPHLDGWDTPHLKGLRLGLYEPWFADADPAIVAACRRLLDALREAGAEVVPVELPELGLLSVAHTVTIVAEMLSEHGEMLRRQPDRFGHDVRLSLQLASHFSAGDYVLAQRHRARLTRYFAESLQQVDAIVTPTTGCVAPPIQADALGTGESDLPRLDTIMRFIKAGNLTGLPALTLPAGYDPDGLPIGFQIMGRAWEEHVLFRIGLAGERAVERRLPASYHRLLTPS